MDRDISFWPSRCSERISIRDIGEAMKTYVNGGRQILGYAVNSVAWPLKTPHPDIETNLYRVAPGSLNTSQKHAAASDVAVLLEVGDQHIIL